MAGLVIINLICMARNLTQEGSFDLWHVHTVAYGHVSIYSVIAQFPSIFSSESWRRSYSGNFPQQNVLCIPCIPAIVCGPLPCIVCAASSRNSHSDNQCVLYVPRCHCG